LDDNDQGVHFYTAESIVNFYEATKKADIGADGITGGLQGPWQGP